MERSDGARASGTAWTVGLLTAIYTFAFIDRQILAALAEPSRRDLALSDTQIGLLGGLAFAFLNAFASLPLARLAERGGRVSLIAIGIALARRDPRFYLWLPAALLSLCVPIYLIALPQADWRAAMAGLVIIAFLQYSQTPLLSALTQNMVGDRMRATASSLVGIVTNLFAAGCGPLFVGAASDFFAAARLSRRLCARLRDRRGRGVRGGGRGRPDHRDDGYRGPVPLGRDPPPDRRALAARFTPHP